MVVHLILAVVFAALTVYVYKLHASLRVAIKRKSQGEEISHAPSFLVYLYPVFIVYFVIMSIGNLLQLAGYG
ncbi:hypothetical protein CHH28_02810 [Bacterioplanes sanyensis]|uniref:Uncharacterized protein n=1 Tax=Bacterioplanes sanyensis TaxID=1249553 RepID=A0A222FGQ5_9GAMM|nr:hypothetical protein CHH28_02810 [Bacterioplanes sanyensis]